MEEGAGGPKLTRLNKAPELKNKKGAVLKVNFFNLQDDPLMFTLYSFRVCLYSSGHRKLFSVFQQ